MVDAPDLKSVVLIGRGSSSLPLGTKVKVWSNLIQ